MSAAPYLFYRYPFCHRPVRYRRGCPKRCLGADFLKMRQGHIPCADPHLRSDSLYIECPALPRSGPRALSGDDSRINSRPQPLSMIVGIGYTGWGSSKENQHNHPGFQGEFPLGASFPSLSRGERGCPRTSPTGPDAASDARTYPIRRSCRRVFLFLITKNEKIASGDPPRTPG